MREFHGWAADVMDAVGCPAIPIHLVGTTANGLLYSGRALVRGWSIANGNAAAVDVQLRDGTDISGGLISYFGLQPDANSTITAPDVGILLSMGLYIQSTGFPLVGAVWLTPIGGIAGVAPR